MCLLNVLSDCSPAFNSCPGQCVRRNVYPLVSVFVCTTERGWNNKSNQSVSLCYTGVLQPGKCDTSRFTSRPFPSCAKRLFQGEAKCKAIDMKTIFYSHADKSHFHKRRFSLSLVLKMREFGTRKWPNNKIKLRGLAALFCPFFIYQYHFSSTVVRRAITWNKCPVINEKSSW